MPVYRQTRVKWKRLLLAGAVAWAGSASAQAPQHPAPTHETITVTGRSPAEIRAYVKKMARPEQGHQIARWNEPLCLKVDGLADKFADYIRTRLAAVAQTVDLSLKPAGCQPNLIVKLSDDADGLTKALLKVRPRKVGNITSDTALPAAQVAAFETPRTARWLTATRTMNRDGQPMIRGSGGASSNATWSDSNIRTNVHEEIDSKIIIIDQNRLPAVSMTQLADYIAFVSLATPDIAADYANEDSILAVFAPGTTKAPPGLTGQDMAFLKALYAMPAERPASQQADAIIDQIAHEPSH